MTVMSLHLLPALALTSFLTSLLAVHLVSRTRCSALLAPDVHKADRRMIPKIGGVCLLVSSTVALIACEALHVVADPRFEALMISSILVGTIGLIDDIIGLNPITRVAATCIPPAVILCTGLVKSLNVLLVGEISNPLLVSAIVACAIPIASNAVNMLDVLNGITPSAAILILTTAIVISIIVHKSLLDAVPCVLILSSVIPLYLYNRYPAKVFNGNVGSYLLGTFFGTYMVLYDMCVEMTIAMMPYIVNGLMIVVSIRGIRGRDSVERPTELIGGLIRARRSRSAPLTLVRLVVLTRPRREDEVVNVITMLFAISCAASASLACTASILSW